MLRQVTKVPTKSPALRYLELITQRIRAIEEDVPTLARMGEKMAQPMLDGGELFTPDVAGYWPHEFGERAGGFMGIRSRPGLEKVAGNVAYFSLPDALRWD